MIESYGFQDDAVAHAVKLNGRILVSLDQGLGKTRCALLCLKRLKDALPAVAICPASLKYQWSREATIHVSMRSEILSGMKPSPQGLERNRPLTIINYDILGPWMDYLKELKPRTIIVDECHFLMGRHTQRSRNVRELCKGVPYVIGLSGTPLVNRPADLWPTLNIIRPDIWPSFWPFAHAHCGVRRTPWGFDVRGASNLPQLHQKLNKEILFRRLKKDVIDQLPAKVRTIVPVEMERRKEYQAAVHDFTGWLSEFHPELSRKARKAEQLVKLGFLKRLAAKRKLPSVFDWIDDFLASSDGKLIVFGIHKVIIERLHERYRGQSVVVDGTVTGAKRQEAVDAFQKSKRCRVFIGNIKAAGVGLNLTAASDVLFAEISWSPGDHIQAEDRAYARLSDMHGINVTYIVARDSIESYLLELNQRKQQTIRAVLDGKGRGDNLDVYDQLCEMLEGER